MEHKFTTAQQAVLPLTVYYDHSCVLCRSEILNLSARDTHHQLNMVDCSGAGFDTTQLPFDQQTLMNCIHALDAKGQWLKATDVFVVCYQVANLGRIAKALYIAKPLAEKIYPLIVKHRYTISKLGIHKLFNALTHRHIQRHARAAHDASQACRDGVCTVNCEDKQL